MRRDCPLEVFFSADHRWTQKRSPGRMLAFWVAEKNLTLRSTSLADLLICRVITEGLTKLP